MTNHQQKLRSQLKTRARVSSLRHEVGQADSCPELMRLVQSVSLAREEMAVSNAEPAANL